MGSIRRRQMTGPAGGHDHGEKYYLLNTGMSLVFRGDVVGAAHIFRMAHFEVAVTCDQTMKDACKQADLK